MCFAADLNAFSLLHETCKYHCFFLLFNVLSIQKSPSQTLGSYLWPSTFLTYSACLTCDGAAQHIPQVTLSLFRKGVWQMSVNGTWLKKNQLKRLPLSAHGFASLEFTHPRRRTFKKTQCLIW